MLGAAQQAIHMHANAAPAVVLWLMWEELKVASTLCVTTVNPSLPARSIVAQWHKTADAGLQGCQAASGGRMLAFHAFTVHLEEGAALTHAQDGAVLHWCVHTCHQLLPVHRCTALLVHECDKRPHTVNAASRQPGPSRPVSSPA